MCDKYEILLVEILPIIILTSRNENVRQPNFHFRCLCANKKRKLFFLRRVKWGVNNGIFFGSGEWHSASMGKGIHFCCWNVNKNLTILSFQKVWFLGKRKTEKEQKKICWSKLGKARKINIKKTDSIIKICDLCFANDGDLWEENTKQCKTWMEGGRGRSELGGGCGNGEEEKECLKERHIVAKRRLLVHALASEWVMIMIGQCILWDFWL
jgi:hypothetical protein